MSHWVANSVTIASRSFDLVRLFDGDVTRHVSKFGDPVPCLSRTAATARASFTQPLKRSLRVVIDSNNQGSSHACSLLSVLAFGHHLVDCTGDVLPVPRYGPVSRKTCRKSTARTSTINVDAEEWNVLGFSETDLLTDSCGTPHRLPDEHYHKVTFPDLLLELLFPGRLRKRFF